MDKQMSAKITEEEFKKVVVGARISSLSIQLDDENQMLIKSLTLDNGIIVSFEASGQIGIDAVWASIEGSGE